MDDFSYILEIAKALEEEKIQTPRVYIRRFREEDLEDFCAYASSKKLCRDLGWDVMETREEVEAYFKAMNKKEGITFAVVHKESGKVIGNFGIGLFRELLRNPILRRLRGITFSFAVSEEFQGQGIMTELLKAAIDYCFENHLLDYINCGYFHFNEASKRVQEKCGFQYYGAHFLTRGNEEILTIENLLFK